MRGTPASGVDGGHHDIWAGRDKRPARVRARSRRDAPPPPGKPRRGKQRRSGDLAHLVRGGVPLFYVGVADAPTPLSAPASLVVLARVSLSRVLMRMGASATPSKPTRLLPLVGIAPVAPARALALAPRGRDAADGAHMVGEARPLAQGGDEEERGEDDVVEEDGRDGAGLVLVVVRGDERAVDGELEGCRQRVRTHFGEQGSDARCA